jgi:Rrf2 family nitric oxide-sensitive transcriptional repressor
VNGLVETVRGRNGGLRLKREPGDISIGAVVRASESDFHMAECFDPDSPGCAYSGACGLQGKLREATEAFLAVLDGVTLADLLPGARRQEHAILLHLPERRPAG